jgi:hypothetical protein
MLETLLGWFGVERHDIGRKGVGTYLTRWVLAGRRGGNFNNRRNGPGQKIFLHLFHRSDVEPYFHDHPFAFWSLILWGGYWENTPKGRKWYGPGSLLRRPATWQHRVDLPEGKKCWTLLWIGAKERSWGFHCPGVGFIGWREHADNEAAGLTGCGE